MRRLIIEIFSQTASLAEIIIVVGFLIRFMEWREEVGARRVIFTIVSLILFGMAQLNGRFPQSYETVIVCDILILLCFCRTCLKGEARQQMLGCTIPFLILTVTNILIMQILALGRSIPVRGYLGLRGYYFHIGVILSKVILAGALYLVQRLVRMRQIHLSDRLYGIINGVFIFILVIELMLFYIINYGGYHRGINAMLVFISVGIGAVTLYVGYSMYEISEKNGKLELAEKIKLWDQERSSQIEEIGRADLRERRLLHDYRNHCLGMRELLERKRYEEMKQYLEEITGKYLGREMEYIHTHDKVLDAILNAKIALCREQDIVIHCTVTGELAGTGGLSLGTVLFNLLDNAVEACMKLEKQMRRRIEVLICREEKSVELFVKNTISHSVLETNGGLRSDKEQEGHGIGQQSVEASVREMNGMMEYYEENQMFCTHVFLPFREVLVINKK